MLIRQLSHRPIITSKRFWAGTTSLTIHLWQGPGRFSRLPPSVLSYGQAGIKTSGKAKMPAKPRPKVPDYCDVEPQRDDDGNAIWPAPTQAMDQARAFIREAATSNSNVLLVPDKDADGLSAGVILYRTLTALGLEPSLISVHLVSKGTDIHSETSRSAMAGHSPSYIIVLDQGSRSAPRIIDSPSTKSLIIDHHLSTSFPTDAIIVSACHYPPVATTSLLAYEICIPLLPTDSQLSSLTYLTLIGTHGDLGNTLKWLPPFPDMSAAFKLHTKKSINDAVSLINAPRRTAKYDVISAWSALLASTSPTDLLSHPRLQSARFEINEEVEMNTHTPPKFSQDGRIAVLRINSAAQVHPVIATRWAGYLNSKALEIVICANSGYLEGKVNFSCRIARCARNNSPPVNIIESLKAAANLSTDGLSERLGESFARGHKEASGGIVPVEAFEELMELLKVGVKPEKKEGEEAHKVKKVKTIEKSPQKNTLGNYFAKKS